MIDERLDPDCCKDGWDLVWAGSKTSNIAEINYVAIEGECLAIT